MFPCPGGFVSYIMLNIFATYWGVICIKSTGLTLKGYHGLINGEIGPRFVHCQKSLPNGIHYRFHPLETVVPQFTSAWKRLVVHKVEVPSNLFKSLPTDLVSNGTVVECGVLGPIVTDLWLMHQTHQNAEAKVSPDLLLICGPCS